MADQPNDDGTAPETPAEAAESPAEAPETPAEAPGEHAGSPRMAIESQYIKDLSFENLAGDAAPAAIQHNPNVGIEVTTNVRPLGDNRYEVSLFFRAEASIEGGKTLFIAELTYAGAFALGNVAPQAVPQLLLIDGAYLLFPFARSVLASITRDGGFPPLMINPMDFAALYSKKNLEGAASDGGNGQA